MQDFTADIKYSKQQSVKREKDIVAVIDEIFKEFIRSFENAVIIFTTHDCSFITYDKFTDFLLNATEVCRSQKQNLILPFTIEKNILKKYYMDFSIRYNKDFICFVVDDKFYCFIKKF